MRITNRMLADNAMQNIERGVQRLSKLQAELASGKRITRSADDPAGTARAISYRSAKSAIGKYMSNADEALSWSHSTDAALNSVSDVLSRAGEIAVQTANGTLSSTDRQQLVGEVQQLFEQIVQIGNTKFDNRYLFGGFKTTTAPFTIGGATGYSYNGDSGQMSWEIEPGSTIAVNVPGSQGISAALDALWSLRNALNSGEQAAVSATIPQITSADDSVLRDLASVGGRTNRIDNAVAYLKSMEQTTASLLSTTEDADITQVITDLSTQELAYKAALIAAGRSLPASLLDYMR